ncbi:DUF4148 domain-containing protein [Burkholderia sp. MS455]|uniref:DUF4148 domain-containing protein n=1 Tax=Burkholderia pyrrocinia TaxID=60550 RepID=A0A318IWG1_BURPY|nr:MULTISPECIES: DUF4148 domain-containing protein [Burkholderia]PXX38247.1 hypothetical protein NA66_1003225 [Burkholderia pyrrocinia]QRR06041.1 DUF4148 domain-containing protein [Burkholderia sp. MS455]SFW54358.1 hypothetical protein SAMN03159384_02767 [Burkholderia sp. NFACC33-1]SFX55699.1 hypothetical protein SAMN03159408_01592 [Burkholderia sp. NFPP32]
MKTMYKAALAAVCMLGAAGLARADGGADASPGTPSDAAISATAVGSMPSAGSQAGGPAAITRAQVKQELIRAQKSGELDRMNQFYGGGE